MNDFLAPITELLPEEHLRRVVPLAVCGILARETPVIAAMDQRQRILLSVQAKARPDKALDLSGLAG